MLRQQTNGHAQPHMHLDANKHTHTAAQKPTHIQWRPHIDAFVNLNQHSDTDTYKCTGTHTERTTYRDAGTQSQMHSNHMDTCRHTQHHNPRAHSQPGVEGVLLGIRAPCGDICGHTIYNISISRGLLRLILFSCCTGSINRKHEQITIENKQTMVAGSLCAPVWEHDHSRSGYRLYLIFQENEWFVDPHSFSSIYMYCSQWIIISAA